MKNMECKKKQTHKVLESKSKEDKTKANEKKFSNKFQKFLDELSNRIETFDSDAAYETARKVSEDLYGTDISMEEYQVILDCAVAHGFLVVKDGHYEMYVSVDGKY